MKFNISLALLLGMGVMLTSCFKNDEADIFDKTASERLEQAKKDYANILTSNGGKWELQYFANSSEEGYDYLLTFSKDGTVQISGYNKWIGESKTGVESNTYGTDNSLWEIITDNGPVLSFNTFNSVFHIFADPNDIGSTSTNEAGRGHEGDYEFDLMKYSGDTLYIEGKKHGLNMIMTRVDEGVQDETFLNEVMELKDNLFSPKIPRIYLTLANGQRYVVSGGSDGIISYFPEGTDSIVTTETANCIVSHEGISFLEGLKVDGNQTIQRFVRQLDGSLLCTDDGKATISAGPLVGVFTHKSLSWTINGSYCTGKYLELYNKLVDQVTATKAFQVTSVRFIYLDSKKYPLQRYGIEVSIKRKAQSATSRPFFMMNPVVATDGTLSYTDFEASSIENTAAFSKAYPAIQEFAAAVAADKFEFSSYSALSPTTMVLKSANNNDDSIMVGL